MLRRIPVKRCITTSDADDDDDANAFVDISDDANDATTISDENDA